MRRLWSPRMVISVPDRHPWAARASAVPATILGLGGRHPRGGADGVAQVGERGAHAARPIVSPNTSSTSRSIKRRCLRWVSSCGTTRRRPFLPRYGFRTWPW
jgi:hypothetical protein